MEKETVLILLLLKSMTKTSQLNDTAIMIYHGGWPVLKYQFLDFCHYFYENHLKDMKIKKEIVLLLTNKSTKWKIQGRCFQTRTQSQIAFQDGGLKASFHGL